MLGFPAEDSTTFLNDALWRPISMGDLCQAPGHHHQQKDRRDENWHFDKKRACYIDNSNEILQEFSFSHPSTKIKINSIYNSHLTGSCLWDLFGREAVMMENTWNASMRLMLDVPRDTHRYLIEPLSKTNHVKSFLINRFLSFLQQIRNSSKAASKFLLDSILLDDRSTTGSNLRNILLLTDKADVSQLVPNDAFFLHFSNQKVSRFSLSFSFFV